MINAKHFLTILLVLSFSLVSCSQEPAGTGPVLAEINDFTLFFEEFEEKLVADLNMEADYKLDKEQKWAFLEQLIREELLVQEAVRLGLDRDEKFIKSIERYWKATLVRAAMQATNETIIKKAYVSQDEIDAYYKTLDKSEVAFLPKQDLEFHIAAELKEKKKSEALRDWITNLRKTAVIKINEDLLYGK